jgi:aspartate racemase
MKTLGMLGGVGPESTVEYYRTIIALYRERAGDGSYPQFIINSIDLKKEIELVERNELRALTDFMLVEVEKLAQAGADFGLIASNTPHIVYDDLQSRSPLPLLSIVETACQAAKARALKRIALFGTRFTMQGQFYPKVFSREGIELVIPDREDKDYIHDKYMNELVVGKFLPETRAGLLGIIDKLKAEKRIDAVILAGTELPLILRDPIHHGIPILDTMRIHVQAAVAEMFSQERT